jgi:hypothetical protein
MKKNFTTKMILSVAVIFASLTAVSAQSYDNSGYNQSAYQDQYTQQAPAQQYQQQYPQQAQYAQTNQYAQPQGYYYYPDANVYYNPTCNNYIYYNGASWLTVGVLPYNIRLGGLPRMMVYYRGPQVWLDNNIHRSYYANNYYGRRPQVVAYNNNYYRGGYNNFNRGNFNGGGFNRGGGYARGGGFSRGGGFGHHR